MAYAYEKFRNLNMLKTLSESQKWELYDTVIAGTKNYLGDYR